MRHILRGLIRQRLELENLPDQAEERIDSAGLPELEVWTLRVPKATSLDDVFGAGPEPD